MLVVYRSEVRYRFFTASGRAVVASITASFGCKRKTKTIVEEISHEICASRQKGNSTGEEYLRAEMKAHYKLAETGVISRKACSKGHNPDPVQVQTASVVSSRTTTSW